MTRRRRTFADALPVASTSVASASVTSQQPAKVTVKIGKTINLGDFDSIRFDFGAEFYLEHGESYEDAFARGTRIVRKVLDKQTEKYE